MKIDCIARSTIAALLSSMSVAGHAFTFESGSVKGSFDSTVTLGVGIRAENQSCSLVIKDSSGTGNPQPTGRGAPSGCTEYFSGLNDQGNLNYNKNEPFTTYLKGTHELLLRFPDEIKFMARASWLRDFSATHTTGYTSAVSPSGVTSLTDKSDNELSFKARLLDFWVSKDFNIGEERARVRVGNQVISWGESLFIPGGINQINSMDYMRLSQPGTQLKEVFLPAPMVSFATGLGKGFSLEAYYQSGWQENYFPPVGSYWNSWATFGPGSKDYGYPSTNPRNSGQYGASIRWQPADTQFNLGFYAIAYHDKTPNFSYNVNGVGGLGMVYQEDLRLYGVSANFPIGDWAIGAELSYRPKDLVSLNPNTGCLGNGGNCFVEEGKYQAHLTGMLSLTPSDYPAILNFLGASTATLMVEAVAVRYPGLKKFYNGDPIGAGAYGWGNQNDIGAAPQAVGDKTSWAYNFDFSWVYDGTLIEGWQVIPEIYYYEAVSGRTPNISAQFMDGARSANFIVTFVKNPASWQAGVNYAKFWKGKAVFDQPYADRDFLGAYVSRNF
ncbi:MAG: DUF1302 domain-containing protein [Methyloversatilis sp.]|jgi:hypothetical protein|uniref:DUF1302 domain-containing protein n=1 Tax=Methyloversatilis TaxID=378210 RepID=UPI0025E45BB0|nr:MULTISPECIES: DUF1302 domain-containing protein [Methyloversatilis]MBT9519199.1 DUF1302 domain-containing protein [Methyloversatilis discipulorum]MCR6664871.1 DUF1302 domain-containing protein [Methyloversatilis sp.]